MSTFGITLDVIAIINPIVMENCMDLILSHTSSNAPIDSFIRALEQLIIDLKQSKNDLSENVKYCLKLRRDRKKFCGELLQLTKKFHLISERKQMEIELHLYNAINDIDEMFPALKVELREDAILPFRLFLIREIKKTLEMFKKHQSEMAKQLYPDKSKEILSNPDLYQNLVNIWGDLANDED